MNIQGVQKKGSHRFYGFKTNLEALNGFKSKSGRTLWIQCVHPLNNMTTELATVQIQILNRLITHFHNQQTIPTPGR